MGGRSGLEGPAIIAAELIVIGLWLAGLIHGWHTLLGLLVSLPGLLDIVFLGVWGGGDKYYRAGWDVVILFFGLALLGLGWRRALGAILVLVGLIVLLWGLRERKRGA